MLIDVVDVYLIGALAFLAGLSFGAWGAGT